MPYYIVIFCLPMRRDAQGQTLRMAASGSAIFLKHLTDGARILLSRWRPPGDRDGHFWIRLSGRVSGRHDRMSEFACTSIGAKVDGSLAFYVIHA
jgi:hypothetical protein